MSSQGLTGNYPIASTYSRIRHRLVVGEWWTIAPLDTRPLRCRNRWIVGLLVTGTPRSMLGFVDDRRAGFRRSIALSRAAPRSSIGCTEEPYRLGPRFAWTAPHARHPGPLWLPLSVTSSPRTGRSSRPSRCQQVSPELRLREPHRRVSGIDARTVARARIGQRDDDPCPA